MTITLPRALLGLAIAVSCATPTDPASAAERKPVLEYVKPGVEVTFVSKARENYQGLAGWTFVLERWSEYDPPQLRKLFDAGAQVKLSFTDDRMSGLGPCNTLSADYSLEGETVRIGPVMRSKRACANEELAEMEERVVRFLERVERAERVGSGLALSAGGDDRMTFWGTRTPAQDE
jgi:heat shock protein HslJ